MYYAAQDVLEYLMNTTGGGAQDSEHRLLRAAAHHAYRDVTMARDWLWYVTQRELPAADLESDGRVYVLPPDVYNVDSLVPPDRVTVTSFITPNEWRRLESWPTTSTTPIYWTLMRAENRPDCWAIKMAYRPPASPTGTPYYYTCRRKPKPLKYFGYEPACRNGSLTADNAAGAVKRYGTAANFPEGLSGVHPYTAQEILGQPGSLVGEAADNARTVVSDWLDMSETMYTALLSSAEVWLARLQGKNVEGALQVYQRDLRLAIEMDVVSPISGRRLGVDRYPDGPSAPTAGSPRSMGYYSSSAPDQGTTNAIGE
jgi:hypothetical protein